ncbi:choline BCCT transporter BetT [Uruburuella testudinis]|uniref:Choline BCCT transporter BetT n=1 Tax=Uruburuella testudinis TaxID=1282863 RepID=A0ABY4DWA2_9NEIS|nr:choline BCCT transporter BetT [Uruburuella testudinis]UOO82912.1 choline BCCT transporter BetT [Uruburuella testudinis]
MSEQNSFAQESARAKSNINPPVFYSAAIIIVAIMLFAVILPELADSTFKSVQAAIVENASWYYVLTVGIILLTCVFLGVSRYGNIKLGPDHSRPDYKNISWFAMLFSAGMGIGLMFFGVAEPVMHFLTPPHGDGGTVGAAREAMRLTFFHWGLHAWAVYAIVALILAFFSYRHNLPLTLRSALYPLIGDKIYGPIGHAVDVFAVVGTLFGLATSLGYGALQVNAGINHLFPAVPVGTLSQVVLIIAITALATISVVSGLDRGVKMLSELNIGLAVVLLLFVLLAGSTVFLLQAFVQNVGYYLSSIVNMTFNLFAYEKTDWFGGWTILYWGWWVSWAPFVGLFIARVSRGRTIREFITGVLLVPAGFTFMWMTFFGNSAIEMILNQGIVSLGEVVSQDVSLALFAFLEQLPFATVFTYVALLMIVVFFVTSADSGALVMDMLCAYGEGSTGVGYRIFWAAGAGAAAIALLLAGGLGALQTMAIASALPFVTVLMVAIYGLFKALNIDAQKQEVLQLGLTTPLPAQGSGAWRERLQVIMDFPNREVVQRFVDRTVKKACEEVAEELRNSGLNAEVSAPESGQVVLSVHQGEEIDFTYQVVATGHIQPEFAQSNTSTQEADEAQKYYRAEVHLGEGGQDYDIMGWSREGVINDIISQYHKHLHFLHSLR